MPHSRRYRQSSRSGESRGRRSVSRSVCCASSEPRATAHAPKMTVEKERSAPTWPCVMAANDAPGRRGLYAERARFGVRYSHQSPPPLRRALQALHVLRWAAHAAARSWSPPVDCTPLRRAARCAQQHHGCFAACRAADDAGGMRSAPHARARRSGGAARALQLCASNDACEPRRWSRRRATQACAPPLRCFLTDSVVARRMTLSLCGD